MQFGQIRQSSALNPASILILVLVYALLWFGTLNYRHLIPSDEGRYAEIAREKIEKANGPARGSHELGQGHADAAFVELDPDLERLVHSDAGR